MLALAKHDSIMYLLQHGYRKVSLGSRLSATLSKYSVVSAANKIPNPQNIQPLLSPRCSYTCHDTITSIRCSMEKGSPGITVLRELAGNIHKTISILGAEEDSRSQDMFQAFPLLGLISS